MAKDWREQWLDLMAPDEPHKLARRLAWDEKSDIEFLADLTTSPQELNRNWERYLQLCRESLSRSWDKPLLAVTSDEDQRPFEDLWEPIKDLATDLLQENTKSIKISKHIHEELAQALIARLCSIGEQVLWEVFNQERTPGAMLLAHLGSDGDGSGPPVRETYKQFIEKHRRDGLSQILEDFPELGRFIGTVMALWVEASSEMLQRLNKDRKKLEEVFGIPEDACLNSTQQQLSDPHRGGRVVTILGFVNTNGERHKLVYKPKNMAIDNAYQEAIKDLNNHSKLQPLRRLKIHVAGDYGYMEYISHDLATNDEDLKNFYTNAGRLTAILHVLGCTDCHHENLIANRDQLVLIDTETLLEAEIIDHQSPASSNQEEQETIIQKQFKNSVLRSGLLPQWMFLGERKIATDISALGISPPQKNKAKVPGWIGINSDGMIPARISKGAEVPTSLPVGIGARNRLQEFIDDFCYGFEKQSEVLIERRDAWLAPEGVLESFKGLRRRIVLRATRVYFGIQRQQLAPAALRSPLTQALQLEQLTRSYLLSKSKPLNWPVCGAEIKQMQLLDIPFFTHAIDSDALDLDEHSHVLAGFMGRSGLSAARGRLQGWCDKEIQFQIQLVRSTCIAHKLHTEPEVQNNQANESQSPNPSWINGTGQNERNKLSKRLMKSLASQAIHDSNGHVEWLGMDVGADGESFSFGPVGMSVYGGAMGIAILADRLNSIDGECNERKEYCHAILQPLRKIMETNEIDKRLRWWRDQPLGLIGCGGIIGSLQNLRHQSWVEILLESCRDRFIDADRQFDIMGGCAGLIGPLIRQGGQHAMQLAIHAGNHLVSQQNHDGSWTMGTSGEPGLLGLSHGTAGIAAALAVLHSKTKDDKFLHAAQKALNYERSNYDKEKQNWPDFRNKTHLNNEATKEFMISWCHGAPGIGLSRACLWQTELWDEHCIEEITIATKTTLAYLNRNQLYADHICCGKTGLIIILESLCEGPWMRNMTLKRECGEIINTAIDDIVQRCSKDTLDVHCFSTREGSLMLPGLFTGLSGIAMAMMTDQESRDTTLNLITAGLWPREKNSMTP